MAPAELQLRCSIKGTGKFSLVTINRTFVFLMVSCFFRLACLYACIVLYHIHRLIYSKLFYSHVHFRVAIHVVLGNRGLKAIAVSIRTEGDTHTDGDTSTSVGPIAVTPVTSVAASKFNCGNN